MALRSLFLMTALVLAWLPAGALGQAQTSSGQSAPNSAVDPDAKLPVASQIALPAAPLAGAPLTQADQSPTVQASDPLFRDAVQRAVPDVPAVYDTEPYRLRLHNLHTLEDIDLVYRIGDNYLPESVARLNYFLRDYNTQDRTSYDPREFDLLHDVLIRLGRPDATIDIVCGYRTQETNEMLRARSQGVAEHSQHILGHAIDIQVPGSSTLQIRNAALSLNEGGVGYYPTTHFVHVDVGAIRTWTYSPHHHLRRAAARRHSSRDRHHHGTHAAGV